MDPLQHFEKSAIHKKLTAYMLVKYRWIFVLCFLLPLSVLYNIYSYFRHRIIFYLSSAPKLHDNRVKTIQKQVRDWKEANNGKKMCTARPGWQTMSFRVGRYKTTHHRINVNMIDIIHLDLEDQTVLVEPMVSMGQLSSLLLPLGWTLPVLPELDDLTVGGLLMGTGVETSSHRHGLFQHTCQRLDMVLPDGQLMSCSPSQHPDLFYAAFWSYGTLGFLVAAQLRIVPARKYIKMDYRPCHTQSELVEIFNKESCDTKTNEFVEGIVYGPSSGVIMIANMTDDADPNKINSIGKWYKPWFYKHVESILGQGRAQTEFIPLRDYYHRHSRSIFWEIEDIMPFGNNLLFRYLLGWTVPPKISLLKLTQGETVKKMYEMSQMIQDMLVPMKYLSESLDKFEEEANLFPLWLCPFVLPAQPGMLRPRLDQNRDQANTEVATMYVDIGAYGVPKTQTYNARETTRRLEQFVRDVGGFQMLYADTYMTRAEFRDMFDHDLYDRVRRQYACEPAFPEVYDKVSKDARQ